MKLYLRSKYVVASLTMVLLISVISAAMTNSLGHARAAAKDRFSGHVHVALIAPSLGTAANFAALGAATVTNTGATSLVGNLGVNSGTACTGFAVPCTGGPGIVNGTIYAADPVAAQAQTDASLAYSLAFAQACTTTFPPITDIGGMILTPGVYCFPSSAGITGTLTLDAQNNPNAAFIFRIGSTLITASASAVALINGGQPSNVFWQVGSSATLGTTTNFAGIIVALASVTVTTGATPNCGLYALNGSINLDSNTIQICSAPCQKTQCCSASTSRMFATLRKQSACSRKQPSVSLLTR